ncbi:DUF2922 domain-containing protein [Clostridium magnum]|uniref:DUF2922 domain-containing protein n=1 Tax=Clostridium magnum DSM 2767 TaxID=1121326 RepID=A0A161W1X8_9CLOT|nr:DUF2922 domain-containing protein [Clostridium magnum]KZL89180.1 hypothetical protein CLMAG_53980 [Clostridium magnum DSM 2767]SHJ24508.1 Protein of unknown function [Clostridium magnum DSM 2767]
MGHKLVMRFTTEEDGKYFSMSIDNIKIDEITGQPSVTEAEVNTLMDLIVQKKIFATSYGAIVGKKDAKVVSTTSQEFTIA